MLLTCRVAKRVGGQRRAEKRVYRNGHLSPVLVRRQASFASVQSREGAADDSRLGQALPWSSKGAKGGEQDDGRQVVSSSSSSSSSSDVRSSPYRPLVLENLIKSISIPIKGVTSNKIFVTGEGRNIDSWQSSGLVSAIYVCLQTGNIDRALKIAENKRLSIATQRKGIAAALAEGTISRQEADRKYKDIRALNYEMHDIRIHNGFLQAFVESMDKVPGQGRWEAAVDYYRNIESIYRTTPNDSTIAIMLKGCAKQETMGLATREPHEVVAVKLLRDLATRVGINKFGQRLRDVLQDSNLVHDPEEAKKVAYTIKRSIATAGTKPINVGRETVTSAEVHMILDNFIMGITASEKTTSMQQEQVQSAPLALEVPEVKSVEAINKTTAKMTARAGENPEVFNLTLLKGQLTEMMQATFHGLTPIERQRQLESSAYDSGRARLKHAYEEESARTGKQSGAVLGRKSVRSLLWIWHTQLEDRIRAEMASRAKRKVRHSVPYDSIDTPIAIALDLMAPEKLSNITISEMIYMTGSDTGLSSVPLGIKTARALLAVGKAVEMEHYSEMQAKRSKAERDKRQSFDDKAHASYVSGQIYKTSERDQLRLEHSEQDRSSWLPKWSDPDRARVGALLVGMLLDVAKVTQYAKDPETGKDIHQDAPAFHHTYQYIQGKRQGLIKLHPALSEQLAQEPVSHTVHPRLLPMLVLPRPWVNWNSGGYHFTKSQVMRTKACPEQSLYIKTASNRNELNVIFNGLDVLGSTAWMVNQDMFEVVLNAWNQGIEIGKLPAKAYSAPMPPRPEDPSDQAQRQRYRMSCLEHFKNIREVHAQRCDVNYKLEIARAFLGEVMYFPHSLDFRGRAYPIPPNFNHMGNDLCRGLLLFAQAKPLGESGLRWLKVHLAGKYGFDKAKFADREQWTNDHMNEIADSADAPLTGQRWWLGGDDPWQTLAACKELMRAVRSPDPLKFASQLPIHQDGTCNGLQHYAALGGDAAGARQVNLVPGDRPADVYSGVADIVRAEIVEDAKAGIDIAQILQDKVTRKVVKQTIMTTVYGVTFIGAKEQIYSQLKDRGDIPFHRLHEAGIYIAKKVLRSIGSEFRGASAIQVWLSETARLIAKSVAPDRIKHLDSGNREPQLKVEQPVMKRGRTPKKSPSFLREVREEQMTAVIWTSPVGLTCVQPYRREAKSQVLTSLQTIFIQDPNVAMPVDPTKQASAFPPNFIHSLDASHMFLTAIECKARDLAFASVHDSYWTHACDIDLMSELIRDTFAKLHSAPILVDLRKEFLQRYKDHKVAVLSVSSRHPAQAQAAAKIGSLHTVSEEKLDELQGVEMSPDEVRVATEKALLDAKKKRTALQSAEVGFEDINGGLDAESSTEDAALQEDSTSSNIGDEVIEASGDIEAPSKSQQMSSIHDRTFQHARGKWVNLVDIIPDLPERGAFDVEITKDSLYFFS